MFKEPDEPYTGEGKSIEEAAENAARTVPASFQSEWFEVKVGAQLSGEHNPIHGYRVSLSPGSP